MKYRVTIDDGRSSVGVLFEDCSEAFTFGAVSLNKLEKRESAFHDAGVFIQTVEDAEPVPKMEVAEPEKEGEE